MYRARHFFWNWDVFEGQLVNVAPDEFMLLPFGSVKDSPGSFEWNECEEFLYTTLKSFSGNSTFSLFSLIVGWLLQ